MRAATIREGRIVVDDHPDPSPGAGQMLVRIMAAGLNGADLLQVRGGYPAPAGSPRDIPGLELAGVVESLGPGAERFEVGDRVMAVVGGGGQAELAVVHEREAMPVPDGIDWLDAGGFPEVYTTAHDALFTQAGLQMGERLCVHGAAGGVGTAAVQLGVACGAVVTATVRSADLRDAVTQLGATVMDPAAFGPDRGPFDVILELVGAANLEANLGAIAVGGRISVIGIGAGGTGQINLGVLMFKRARLFGSTLRARPLEGKAQAARLVEHHVLPLLGQGRVRVPVHSVFDLADVAAAYEHFAAGGKFGKVVLRCGAT